MLTQFVQAELKGTFAEDSRGEGLELYLMPTWSYLGWPPAALWLHVWFASPSLRRPVVLLGHRCTAPHQQTPMLLHQNQFLSCWYPLFLEGYAQRNLFHKMCAAIFVWTGVLYYCSSVVRKSFIFQLYIRMEFVRFGLHFTINRWCWSSVNCLTCFLASIPIYVDVSLFFSQSICNGA